MSQPSDGYICLTKDVGMLDALIAASSAATLALLAVCTWLLTRLSRRMSLLEHREEQRVEAQRILNTPRHSALENGKVAEPELRRRHLALYQGGGAAAALITIGVSVRAAWRAHRPISYTVAAATATTGFVAAVYITGGGDSDSRGQLTPPVAVPTATRTSEPTPPSSSSSPSPSPTRSTLSPSRTPPPTAPPPTPSSVRPIPSPSRSATLPDDGSLPGGEAPAVPSVPAPSVTAPPHGGPCTAVDNPPILKARLCLLNGR